MAEGERTRRWWIAFAVVTSFAVTLSVLAYSGRLSQDFFQADKQIHFAMAGLLAFTLDRATGARSLRAAIVLLAIFGVDELTQRLSVHRSSTFEDYAADAAGVLVFTGLSRLFSKARRAKPTDDVAE